jgi:hypothetical protein
MDAIYQKAERRIALRIPPGFKERKEDYRKHGDVVVWLQLLDHGKGSGKPIVWVTRDNKEDWWLRDSGKTVGPRPELIQEMYTTAGIPFCMYTPDQFLKHSAALLKGKISSELKDAAQELHKVAEESREHEIPVTSNIVLGKPFPGESVFLQFRCPHCSNAHTIIWDAGPGPKLDTLFQLECWRCKRTWQAKASDGMIPPIKLRAVF